MPVAGGGFDQCYNAQAAVAAGSLLVVASAVSQAPNDKQQLEPMLDKLGALAEELGKPECLLADTGYFSAANVAACEKVGVEPLIAGPSAASSAVGRALRNGAGSAGRFNAGQARAKERHAREQAEHEAKLAARQAKPEASGKKPRGKPPEPPVEAEARPQSRDLRYAVQCPTNP